MIETLSSDLYDHTLRSVIKLADCIIDVCIYDSYFMLYSAVVPYLLSFDPCSYSTKISHIMMFWTMELLVVAINNYAG